MVSLLPGKGCSRGFAEVCQDDERGGTLQKTRAGAFTLRPSSLPSIGHALRVLGPYLAVDLLHEGLAVLILLLVLADLLELLDRKAVELLHDVL